MRVVGLRQNISAGEKKEGQTGEKKEPDLRHEGFDLDEALSIYSWGNLGWRGISYRFMLERLREKGKEGGPKKNKTAGHRQRAKLTDGQKMPRGGEGEGKNRRKTIQCRQRTLLFER